MSVLNLSEEDVDAIANSGNVLRKNIISQAGTDKVLWNSATLSLREVALLNTCLRKAIELGWYDDYIEKYGNPLI